jgi:hypothetical protein
VARVLDDAAEQVAEGLAETAASFGSGASVAPACSVQGPGRYRQLRWPRT